MYLKTLLLSAGLLIAVSSCFKKSIDANGSPTAKNKLRTNDLPVDSGLTVSTDGNVLLNGKTYRGIGVNYFNAFYRTILNNNDSTYLSGLQYLSDHKIPFIRFSTNGFWPNEWNLYLTDSTKYFNLLDKFVHAAEKRHIGLIPSLFFNDMTVCDIQHEHRNQWSNYSSNTIALMRRYTASMVARYKNSPAIWGWEFGNEMNAYTDLLSVAGSYLPHTNTAGGTPSSRTLADAIGTHTIDSAYNEFARVIRLLDTKHMIFTGNAMPEWNNWHRFAVAHPNEWNYDHDTDFQSILDAQNPSSIGTITVHFYYEGTNETNRFTHNDSTLIATAMAKSLALKRPLFVGEFGVDYNLHGTGSQAIFESELNAIMKNNVPLSAIWVYDFSAQGSTYNVTDSNVQAYQLTDIINANTQLKTLLGY